jgi:di/tricarboxylate transporter
VGQPLAASGLLHLPGLTLTERYQGDGSEALVEDHPLSQSDRLLFVGVLDSVLDLLRTPGVAPATDQSSKLGEHPSNRCYVEAVVSRTSPLLANTLSDVRFREKYGAVVLAVARNGQRLRAPLADVDFRPGDALLLEAPLPFSEQNKNSGDFALLSRLHGEGPATSAQAPIASFILLGMITLVGFDVFSMLQAAALAAAAMLLSRCCSEETARHSIDWPLLLTIGAAFGFGQALEKTGLAQLLADTLLQLADANAWLSLVVVFATTAILTEFVTNNAAAVIVLPIALATATKLGVNHVPFAVAVMLAASASFATPIGYQTNLMVYVAGGYRFSDFLRMGIPMSLVVATLACVLAPLVYGF